MKKYKKIKLPWCELIITDHPKLPPETFVSMCYRFNNVDLLADSKCIRWLIVGILMINKFIGSIEAIFWQ